MHSPERPCGNRGPVWITGVPVAHPGPPGAAPVRLKHIFELGLKMAAKWLRPRYSVKNPHLRYCKPTFFKIAK